MRVALLHHRVGAGDRPDDRDVVVQAARVEEALGRLGHETVRLVATLDLAALARDLERVRPAAVFNLVESLGGHERLIHVVPALLDVLGLPYTGSPAGAVFATTDKLAAKDRMAAAGLPVPPTVAAWPLRPGLARPAAVGRLIVKPVWDHGSLGIDDASVIAAEDASDLTARLRAAAPRLGGACFAEPYLEGREFNLTLLAAPAEGTPDETPGTPPPPLGETPGTPPPPQVLAPAEITFTGYPEGKPRIVGYEAKWRPGSFEYENTPRSFDLDDGDRPLVHRLEELARAAWRLFGLRGYARADFRVDAAGRPFLLEVNVNPCLAPDAGMAAALEASGVPYDEAIRRILDDALAPYAGADESIAAAATAEALR